MSNINAVRGFLAVLGGNAGTLLVSIVTTPILVRLLGTAQYGEFAFIVATYGVLNLIVAPGISTGLRKYIAEDREDSDWEHHVFGFYVRIGVVLVAVVALALWLAVLTGLFELVVPAHFESYVYVLIAWVVLAQFFSIGKNTLRGFGLEHYSEPLLVVQHLLFAVTGLSLVYAGFGVTGALLGKAVAVGATCVLVFVLVARRISLRYVLRRTPSGFPTRDLLSFNFLNILLLLGMTSLYNVDVLLLQVLVGSTETGYYRAALTVAEFLWFVPFAVQTALLHSTSELWSNGERDRITDLAAQVTRFTLLFTALLVVGLVALADPFVTLYFGADFAPAVIPLLLLLPGALGFAVSRPIIAIGQGKGDLRWLIYATGTAAGINLVLNLLLIPRFGMNGAAVATSIGYGSMLGFHVLSAREIGFDPMRGLALPRIAVTVTVATPLIFGLARVLPNTYLELLIVPPVGFLVYTWLAFRTGAIEGDEIRDFLDALPEPLSRFVARLDRHLPGYETT